MKNHHSISGRFVRAAALGLLLTLGSSLGAQVTPAWSSDFSQHKDGELLADAKSYRSRDAQWRLHAGNNKEMPAGTKAVLKNEGALSFAQVTSEGNRSSLNARIVSRDLETITLSTSQNTILGGDIRYIGAGTNYNTNSNTGIMFSGKATNGDVIQITMGIGYSASNGYRFYSNLNDLTNRSLSETLSSQDATPPVTIDPNKWYSFVVEIAPTGAANVKVLDGSEVVWSASADGKFVPASINAVEMQVIRAGRSGYRAADFANIGIGTGG